MTLRSRTNEQWIRLMIIVSLTVLGIYSCQVQAQPLKPIKYVGFEAAFGVRSFQVNSNLPQINGMQAGHEGGSLGVVFGNDLLKAKVRVAGFYYSNANTPRTQELFETAALVNFYPLTCMSNMSNKKAKLRPYITAGVSMDKIKFFGTYLADQKTTEAYEPLLGKLHQLNATAGIGLEYRLPCQLDFVHLFAEALYGAPVQSRASVQAFDGTSVKQFTSFSFGVSFGRHW